MRQIRKNIDIDNDNTKLYSYKNQINLQKMCLQLTHYHSFDKHNIYIILIPKQTKYKHNNKRSAEYTFLKKTCTISFFLMFLHNNAMYQCIKQCSFYDMLLKSLCKHLSVAKQKYIMEKSHFTNRDVDNSETQLSANINYLENHFILCLKGV